MDNLVIKIYFSEYFGIDASKLHKFGAFNVSLINDLPLFIDPFLLFNSQNPEYRRLHDDIIKYILFLRDKSRGGPIKRALVKAWFGFPEVKQTWLGFSRIGNGGSGLGNKFATSLNANLYKIFTNFGDEKITESAHLEKLCLIENGVGRDNISDFVTNLIKNFLLQYTQEFALKNLKPEQRRRINVPKVYFDYSTERWHPKTFELPYIDGDYVILTPRDILTKDDTWINRRDLVQNMDEIALAISDEQLRAEVDNYLISKLASNPAPTEKDRAHAAVETLLKYPELLDYYIRWKERDGDKAVTISAERVSETEIMFIEGVQAFALKLYAGGFYDFEKIDTLEESRKRVLFLKNVIEDGDGYRFFYGPDKQPIRREEDLQILYRLTWFATPSDLNREVNNGRGPVDFKASRGAKDKTLIEFKLAKSSKLEQNLKKQVEIYEAANDTKKSIKVIVYFTQAEFERVNGILKKIGLDAAPNIILIDARADNKPSGSVA